MSIRLYLTNTTLGRNINQNLIHRDGRSDSQPGKAIKEAGVGAIKGARACIVIDLARPTQLGDAVIADGAVGAKERDGDVVADDLGHVVKDAALEETAHGGSTLDGVAAVLCPHAVHGVEKCRTAERGTSARGHVYVVV